MKTMTSFSPASLRLDRNGIPTEMPESVTVRATVTAFPDRLVVNAIERTDRPEEVVTRVEAGTSTTSDETTVVESGSSSNNRTNNVATNQGGSNTSDQTNTYEADV